MVFDPQIFLKRNIFRYTGQLILSEIIKIAATSLSDFKAKMQQIRLRMGSAPDHTGGAYSNSAPQTSSWI